MDSIVQIKSMKVALENTEHINENWSLGFIETLCMAAM